MIMEHKNQAKKEMGNKERKQELRWGKQGKKQERNERTSMLHCLIKVLKC